MRELQHGIPTHTLPKARIPIELVGTRAAKTVKPWAEPATLWDPTSGYASRTEGREMHQRIASSLEARF